MEDAEKYKVTPQTVSFNGLLQVGDSLTLKNYVMGSAGKNLAEFEVDRVSAQLCDLLLDDTINPRSGLGFSILSDGVVNVNVWGNGDSSALLHQSLYLFDRIPPETSSEVFLRKGSLEIDGSFCCYGLGIVSRESREWLKYLRSPRSVSDGLRYLQAFSEITIT